MPGERFNKLNWPAAMPFALFGFDDCYSSHERLTFFRFQVYSDGPNRHILAIE